jgi:hypothetical protein
VVEHPGDKGGMGHTVNVRRTTGGTRRIRTSNPGGGG